MIIRVLASGSSGNATIISDGHTSLLLDAGLSIDKLRKAANYRISSLSGCLITHCHNDHSAAAKELLVYGLPVYMSAGTQAETNIMTYTATALQQFEIGSFKIMPFDVEHDAEEPLGFLLHSKVTDEKVLYATDTRFIRYKFKGLTHIIIECNYDDETLRENAKSSSTEPELAARIFKSHMGLKTLLKFLQATDKSRLRQIYLIHLSKNNADSEKIYKAVAAETGVEVYVGTEK